MTLLISNTVAGTQTPSPAATAQHPSGRCVQTGPSCVLGAKKRHLHAGHHGCSPGGSDGAKAVAEGPCAVSNDSGSSSTLHGTFLPPPHSVLTVFLPLVSSPEVPQGLFQRDAPVNDVPAAHRQGGADTVQTHCLRVLAVLQEGRLRLQQPRDGVGPVMGPRHAVPSRPSGPPAGGLDPSPLPPSA